MVMNDTMFKLLELAVIVCVMLFTAYVLPFLKTKMQSEQYAVIMSWAMTFVKAAEQIFIGEKKGKEKLEAVTKWLTERLISAGIYLTEEQIRALIEDAVNTYNEEKNKQK